MERNKVSVLLVSVDALKPEFVFEQERLGISLPNISKYFVENGTFAGGEFRVCSLPLRIPVIKAS